MEPTQELIDEIYRERVLRARQAPWSKNSLPAENSLIMSAIGCEPAFETRIPERTARRSRNFSVDALSCFAG